jgi:hypothetical protein
MARKLTLKEAQSVVDTHFPNSGLTLKVYTGAIHPGIVEFPDGVIKQFPRFDVLKRFSDVQGLREYLDRHPLNSLPPVTHHTTSISISGDRNTTVHNSPHSTVASTPDPLTPLLQSQNQLVNYLSAISEELPSTVNAALSILIANLQQAQQNLRPKSEV